MKFQELLESITFNEIDKVNNLVYTRLELVKDLSNKLKSSKDPIEQSRLIVSYHDSYVNPWDKSMSRWNKFYLPIHNLLISEEAKNDLIKPIAKKMSNEINSFNEKNWERVVEELKSDIDYNERTGNISGDLETWLPKGLKLVTDDRNHINRLSLGMKKIKEGYEKINSSGMTMDAAVNHEHKGVKISVRSVEDANVIEDHLKSTKKFIDDISKTKFKGALKKLDHVVLADWNILFNNSNFKKRDISSTYAYYINGIIYMPINKSFDPWSIQSIYHEFAHLLHMRANKLLNNYNAQTNYENFKKWHRRTKSINFPSAYSRINEQELFAEMFALYFTPKKYIKDLQEPSPEIAEYFKELFYLNK
jgi:hypothetical protein